MHSSKTRRSAGFGSPYIVPLFYVTIFALIANAFALGFGAARRKGMEDLLAVAVGLGAAIFVFAGFAGVGWLITRRSDPFSLEQTEKEASSSSPEGHR